MSAKLVGGVRFVTIGGIACRQVWAPPLARSGSRTRKVRRSKARRRSR